MPMLWENEFNVQQYQSNSDIQELRKKKAKSTFSSEYKTWVHLAIGCAICLPTDSRALL